MAVMYQVRYPSVSGTGADWRNLELSPLPLSNDQYVLNERRYHQPQELCHWAEYKWTKLRIYDNFYILDLICGFKWEFYFFALLEQALHVRCQSASSVDKKVSVNHSHFLCGRAMTDPSSKRETNHSQCPNSEVKNFQQNSFLNRTVWFISPKYFCANCFQFNFLKWCSFNLFITATHVQLYLCKRKN